MTQSPIQRNHLDYALRMNGYNGHCHEQNGWLIAEATFAPGRCFLTYREESSEVVIATSLSHVARALTDEGTPFFLDIELPRGAAAAFLTNLDTVHAAVRRIYELSRSLPTAPLDRFLEKARKLPATTEAERLVVQRVGQDVFREALMDFWSGRCAITGLDQPELLRASHMKPWAGCATDAERLDPYNGILLAANWDAAFDAGLITFSHEGELLLSDKLTTQARQMFISGAASPRLRLCTAHLPYLTYHRKLVWH